MVGRRPYMPADGERVEREPVLYVLLVPSEDAAAVIPAGFDDVVILLIVHEDVWLVPLEDAAELRLGDFGVEEDDLMAETGTHGERLEEPAVVAAEHREGASAAASRPQRAGDRLD